MGQLSSRKGAPALNKDVSQKVDDLDLVRKLLLGEELKRLNQLQERINDPKLLAQDLSQALPEAVIIRSRKDRQLREALSPTIGDVLKDSVQKNPTALADAIFPAMGPAIRKSITSTIRHMVQSLSRTIDQSFSWRGLKWRLEALRKKKSFSEVVLLHTLIYRVEHVFLIHKKTGLLLQHVSTDAPVTKEVDMVSSMLTAIQDFVQDSLELQKDEGIETMHVGDFTVYIENGSLALLASVVRGNPSQELRDLFKETLETIHLEQAVSLESFDGDTGPFVLLRPLLEDCLKTQYKSKRKKTSFLTWAVVGTLIIIAGSLAFFSIWDSIRWKGFLARLDQEPGITITAVKKSEGQRVVFGLRDPLAADPKEILQEKRVNPDKVRFQLEPYYAYWPEFILKRAKKLLQSPETVSLRVEQGVLYLSGSASQLWIEEARKLAQNIPGVVSIQDSDLKAIEYEQYNESKRAVESKIILYRFETIQLVTGQREKLDELVHAVEQFLHFSSDLGQDVRLEVIGHASREGSEEFNLTLSWDRARHVFCYLISKGIPPYIFALKGVGTNQPIREELTVNDRRYNRSVNIKAILE